MVIKTHTPGSFCTSVLHTRDTRRAAAFYGGLVGWTTREISGTNGHVLLQFGDKTVASLHQITEGDDIWVPYVSVENVERTITDAVALGARIVDRADIPGFARLATLRDTEGAQFGLWQPSGHQGAELTEEVGSLWWIEVLTNNVAAARAFYGSLFGWTAVETSFTPFDLYVVFLRGDVQEGGILPIAEGWELSPRWNSIFAVDDCDAMIDRACSLGGSTGFVHTVPKAGRVGSIFDPGGATFVMRGPVAPTSGST